MNPQDRVEVEKALMASAAEAQHAWLQQLLQQTVNEPGPAISAEDLPAFLPRITLRKYPDGLIVVAIDAEPGKAGRLLFGFGPMEFKPTTFANGRPEGFKWVAPVLNKIEAGVAEASFMRRMNRTQGTVTNEGYE